MAFLFFYSQNFADLLNILNTKKVENPLTQMYKNDILI